MGWAVHIDSWREPATEGRDKQDLGRPGVCLAIGSLENPQLGSTTDPQQMQNPGDIRKGPRA